MSSGTSSEASLSGKQHPAERRADVEGWRSESSAGSVIWLMRPTMTWSSVRRAFRLVRSLRLDEALPALLKKAAQGKPRVEQQFLKLFGRAARKASG